MGQEEHVPRELPKATSVPAPHTHTLWNNCTRNCPEIKSSKLGKNKRSGAVVLLSSDNENVSPTDSTPADSHYFSFSDPICLPSVFHFTSEIEPFQNAFGKENMYVHILRRVLKHFKILGIGNAPSQPYI